VPSLSLRVSAPLLAIALAACAPVQTVTSAAPASQPAAQPAAAEDEHAHHDMEGMPAVTNPAGALIVEADVRFMQGMIAHHAQAVFMTRLAEGAGASPRVLRLAQKIDLSQAGEIELMQGWLRANGQVAPDTSYWRSMRMAGMLTDAELQQLAASRGRDFDRLFLQLMIRHHEGALSMVADLLASPRAAQDVDVNVLANDVENTQMAEIELMLQMLDEMN
jgi:uncharacterized protein (DUF305 family)